MNPNPRSTETLKPSIRVNGFPADAACLSVIMPCYNEAGTVDEIIGRVLARPEVRELIVIDDGSTDATWNQLQAWPQRDARVRLLKFARNQGKGAAVRHGFSLANAPILTVQDADLEYDPTDYERLVAPILSGETMVVYGSRFAKGAQIQTTYWHRLGNRLITLSANLLTGYHLTDEATCYKMFKRELLQKIELKEDGFGFCAEFTAKLAHLNIKIIEVPVGYVNRTVAQGKKLRLKDGLEAFCCLLAYSFNKFQK